MTGPRYSAGEKLVCVDAAASDRLLVRGWLYAVEGVNPDDGELALVGIKGRSFHASRFKTPAELRASREGRSEDGAGGGACGAKK
jgi:hypothetical protein